MQWLPILFLLPLLPEAPVAESDSLAASQPEAVTESEQAPAAAEQDEATEPEELEPPEQEVTESEAIDIENRPALDEVEVGPAVEEAESRPQPIIGLDVTLASTYVFRGVLQYASPVIPSIQPAVSLDFSPLLPGALEFQFWSAFAMADRARVRREGTASELDLVLTYSNSVADGWLELGGGFLYYLYPGEEQVDGEKELIFSIGVGNLPVSLGVTGYFRVHPGLGFVLEPQVGWEQVFGDFSVGVDLLMGASFDEDALAALDYVTLTAGVAQEAGRLTVGIDLSYTLRISPPRLDFLERSLLYGALTVSWAR